MKRKKDDMAAQQEKKDFEARVLEEDREDNFHPTDLSLFIDGWEAKPSPIQIFNLWKVGPLLEIFDQQ